MGTIFGRPAHKHLGEPKNCPKFCAISDNFRLWSRISPERMHITKIGKVVYQLPPLPRWIKKDGELWSINEKVIGIGVRNCGDGRPHVGLCPAHLVFIYFS